MDARDTPGVGTAHMIQKATHKGSLRYYKAKVVQTVWCGKETDT